MHRVDYQVHLSGQYVQSVILRRSPFFHNLKLLVQGDIFLNTSLTEAFCVALLEAVSCG